MVSTGSPRASSALSGNPIETVIETVHGPGVIGDPVHDAVRVVGVGGSAGGLDAFLELFPAIPPDTGLAFVLIQHLDPSRDSMLAGILAAASAIPVRQATDGMVIEPDQVYVIAAGTDLTLEQDVLRVSPRSTRVPRRPMDTFFASLAEAQGSGAIAIVLSGNDADGAAGLQAVREAGGITFAQSPGSAKFDVMPRAAAAAADFVLSPNEIAERLAAIAGRDATLAGSDDEVDSAAFDRVLSCFARVTPSISLISNGPRSSGASKGASFSRTTTRSPVMRRRSSTTSLRSKPCTRTS